MMNKIKLNCTMREAEKKIGVMPRSTIFSKCEEPDKYLYAEDCCLFLLHDVLESRSMKQFLDGVQRELPGVDIMQRAPGGYREISRRTGIPLTTVREKLLFLNHKRGFKVTDLQKIVNAGLMTHDDICAYMKKAYEIVYAGRPRTHC